MSRKRPNQAGLPVPLERDVQASILSLLELLRIPHWRTNAGGGYRLGRGGKPQLIAAAPEGWPDICGWVPRRDARQDGRFLGIEVKRPGEVPRPEQITVLRRINDDGGVAFWADSLGVCHTALRQVLDGASVAMDERGLWRIVA